MIGMRFLRNTRSRDLQPGWSRYPFGDGTGERSAVERHRPAGFPPCSESAAERDNVGEAHFHERARRQQRARPAAAVAHDGPLEIDVLNGPAEGRLLDVALQDAARDE